MSDLALYLLGPPRIERVHHGVHDGQPVHIGRRKSVALLAYLSTSSAPQSRDVLATLLWPDYDQRSARAHLRRALVSLTKRLGSEWFIADRETIGLNPATELCLDVDQFRQRLAACDAHDHPLDTACAECQALLTETVDLYQDDFMAGFTLPDSPAFDEWQRYQTQGLRDELAGALERLAGCLQAQGEVDQAIAYARRWLELDKLHEPAHRRLMELYAQADRRPAALRQYRECMRVLETELGVPPSPETTLLHERIQATRSKEPGVERATVLRTLRGYELHERIGSGGFGEVYRAYQPSVGREVAIKVILPQFANQPEFIQRFEKEAQLVARLEHLHIVPLYNYWRDADGAYLVMRWLRGGDLRASLQRGAWTVEAAARLLDQIASALSVAHRQGVVHRDVKPENIMLDEEGNAYLSDFGIAKDLMRAVGATATGAIPGSLWYISPEQAQSQSVSPQSDLYSLGVVMYEVLTGEHPLSGATPAEQLVKRLTEPLPRLRERRPELPEALEDVVQRATAKDPTERYPNALAFAVTFRGALSAAKLEPAPPVQALETVPQLPAFLEEEAEREVPERPVFVARERELERLNGFLETALAGQGQVVFVTGGPGRGKTALMGEFARRAMVYHEDLLVVMGSCNAYSGVGDPYLPFREILGMLAGDVEARWAAGSITGEHARRIWDGLPATLQALVDHSPSLIDAVVPGDALMSRAATLGPQGAACLEKMKALNERGRTGASGLAPGVLLTQYARVLHALADRYPLLLMLDDMQWSDAGSIDLLFHLGQRFAETGSRILIAGAYRPEEVALDRDGARHPLEATLSEFKRRFGDVWVDLAHVDESQGRRFVDAFLDAEPNRLGEAFRETLYQRTEGHALFTTELVRAMQAQGDLVQDASADAVGAWVEGPSLNWERQPARVDAVIERRINRLETKLRDLLTVASVEGERFTAQVVARVQELPERETLRALSGLARHRLVRESEELQIAGAGRFLSRFQFAHALFQEYLYNSLSAGERRLLHGEVATALEVFYDGQTDEVVAQLAHHYAAAGQREKTIEYSRRAGEQALLKNANVEAIGHFNRALESLATLPDSPERDQEELALLLGLGPALLATHGYAVPEVGRTYTRALELCQQADAVETQQLFPALFSLGLFYFSRGELQKAREIAEQMLSLGQSASNPIHAPFAPWLLGFVLVNLGEIVLGQAYLEEVIAAYAPQQHASLALLYAGQDPGVHCLGYGAFSLWALGYPVQALKRIEESITLARKLDHSHTLCSALGVAAWFYADRRQVRAAQTVNDECIRIATEEGFAFWMAGSGCQAWLLAEEGRFDEGTAQILQQIAVEEAPGFKVYRPYRFVYLAEMYRIGGQVELGLAAVTEALDVLEQTGMRLWEVETHRLKGEFLLMAGDVCAAEACFLHAIEVARQQQTKSCELQATVSLCRLWQAQGKREQARQMLEEIYSWFTEGFDTADLKEAKALLDELSG